MVCSYPIDWCSLGSVDAADDAGRSTGFQTSNSAGQRNVALPPAAQPAAASPSYDAAWDLALIFLRKVT